MDWTHVLTIVGTNIGLVLVNLGTCVTLFLWARSEARADQAEARTAQAEIREIIRQEQSSTRDLIRTIHEEMKDFHGRLCGIEERGKGK